jgi:photosystem II stability/assembly factor-like uncharacterized protein
VKRALLTSLVALSIAACAGAPTGTKQPSSATPLPPGPDVRSAGLLTGGDGWALTATGLLLTSDFGATWRAGAVPRPSPVGGVLGIGFADAGHGWLATLDSANAQATTFDVWRTSDGAQTWQRTALAEGANRSETMGRVELAILDAGHLFLIVEGGMPDGYVSDLYETGDGGVTWSASRTTGPGLVGDLAFADGVSGVLAGGADGTRLYRTGDAGRSWHALTVTLPPDAAGRVLRVDRPTFWTAGDGALLAGSGTEAGLTDATVMRTADGGASWSPVAGFRLSSAEQDPRVALVGPEDWLAMPGPSTRLWTGDSGRTWSRGASVGLPGAPRTLQLADPTHGWALVDLGGCTGTGGDCQARTGLYATADGGASWSALGVEAGG